ARLEGADLLREPAEEAEVAVARQRAEQSCARRRAAPLERAQQGARRTAIVGVEPPRLFAQALEQDVEVANGPELLADPLELVGQRAHVVRVQRAARAPKRARATHGDAHV